MKTLILTFSILLISCQPNTNTKEFAKTLQEQSVLAALYQQRASEVKAMQIQAYKLGAIRLEQILMEKKYSKKPAIVVDIDETVLDNSPYQAKQVFSGETYPKGWDDWCKLEKAEPIAGALEFLNTAVKQGVDVFYISNRKIHLLESTINNLKTAGFPQVEKEQILLRTATSSKIERRSKVSETHEIVLLFGDNLSDFTNGFEAKTLSQREQRLYEIKEDLATKFITLPNALYGAWEAAAYNNNFAKTRKEKSADRKAALIQY